MTTPVCPFVKAARSDDTGSAKIAQPAERSGKERLRRQRLPIRKSGSTGRHWLSQKSHQRRQRRGKERLRRQRHAVSQMSLWLRFQQLQAWSSQLYDLPSSSVWLHQIYPLFSSLLQVIINYPLVAFFKKFGFFLFHFFFFLWQFFNVLFDCFLLLFYDNSLMDFSYLIFFCFVMLIH